MIYLVVSAMTKGRQTRWFLQPVFRKNIVYRHDVAEETSITNYARALRLFAARRIKNGINFLIRSYLRLLRSRS